jgi:hypothetical protein
MSNPMQSWWKLAQSLGDIAWHAPQVVQHRTARLLAAPGLKRARDRREAQRMVAEKFEAMFETQLALWQHAWTMQQRMAQEVWRAALSGPRPRRVRSSAGSRRSAAASLSLASRSLAPVRRRVKANSRRLRLR